MKRIINIIIILVTAAAFTSCEDVIDLDIPK
jgi:predicted small secreted protein